MTFREQLKSALALDLQYPLRARVSESTAAAVLVLLTPTVEGELEVLLTVRTEKVQTHKGQIAFPGGMIDPVDERSSDRYFAAALRETQEEVGIDQADIEILGRLPTLMTLTGFSITPVVGVIPGPSSQIALRFSEDEIAASFWAPLSLLRANYHEERFVRGDKTYPIDVFYVGAHRIWGATGSILKNLLDRLTALG